MESKLKELLEEYVGKRRVMCNYYLKRNICDSCPLYVCDDCNPMQSLSGDVDDFMRKVNIVNRWYKNNVLMEASDTDNQKEKDELDDVVWRGYFLKNGLPKTCADCPLYELRDYTCHNERGKEAYCKRGYMTGDLRGKNFSNRVYLGCRLKDELQL